MNVNKLDPKNANHAVLGKILSQMQVIKGDKGDQGEPGKTPKKGEDYFTDSEIAAIIKYVQQNLTKGDKGDSGDQGEKGNDGYDGVDGVTPVKGVDYFTKSEQAELITTVLRSIKVPKDGVSPKAEDVAKIILSSTPKKSAEDEFITIKQLVDFLKRGGFRGGGGSSSGSSISLTTTGTSGPATLVGTVLNVPNYSAGGITRTVVSTAVPVTAGATVSTDYVYLVSGTTTITLPTAVGNTNRYSIKRVGVNTVTVATTAAQTIDGSATAAINVQYQSLDFISDNANWNVI